MQDFFAAQHEAAQRGLPIEQVRELRTARRLSRRDFLRAAADIVDTL